MDNKSTKIDSSENRQGTYSDEFNDLQYNLLLNTLEQEKELHTEKLLLQKQKRYLGLTIAGIAAIVPLGILGILLCQIMDIYSGFHKMEYIPQAIFISASFLSFIVIYTVLIKGMFEQKKEETSLTLKEATGILRELRQNAPNIPLE